MVGMSQAWHLFCKLVTDDSVLDSLMISDRFAMKLIALMEHPDAVDDEGDVTEFGRILIGAFTVGFFAGRVSIWEKVSYFNPDIPMN